MALSTDNVRRTQVVDPQAYKARLPARDVDSRLPMAFLGRAVDTLDHGDEGPPVSLDPTPEQYAKFRKAIWTLADPRVQRLMDSLDADGVNGMNGRFGTNGISRLSQLDENSPEWDLKTVPWSEAGPVTLPEERREIIDAARTVLLYNNPGGLLEQVHGGDQIFEPGDMLNWFNHSVDPDTTGPDLDVVRGAFKQKPGSASSPFYAAFIAVRHDQQGAELLKDMIKVDARGDYQVTFRGDPLQRNQRTVVVPRAVVQSGLDQGSDGNLGVRILEEASKRYHPQVNVGGVARDSWGDEASNLTLLTGASPVLAGAWPATPHQRVVTREVLKELEGRQVLLDANGMTFAYRQPDGRVHAYAVHAFDFYRDTVYFRDPYNPELLTSMSITELLAKPQLRVASV